VKGTSHGNNFTAKSKGSLNIEKDKIEKLLQDAKTKIK